MTEQTATRAPHCISVRCTFSPHIAVASYLLPHLHVREKYPGKKSDLISFFNSFSNQTIWLRGKKKPTKGGGDILRDRSKLAWFYSKNLTETGRKRLLCILSKSANWMCAGYQKLGARGSDYCKLVTKDFNTASNPESNGTGKLRPLSLP